MLPAVVPMEALAIITNQNLKVVQISKHIGQQFKSRGTPDAIDLVCVMQEIFLLGESRK